MSLITSLRRLWCDCQDAPFRFTLETGRAPVPLVVLFDDMLAQPGRDHLPPTTQPARQGGRETGGGR